MITLPFHPNYTILLSTRQEGSITTQEQAEVLIQQAGYQNPVGFLRLRHGVRRVHWKDDTSDNQADAAVTDNSKLCLSMVVGDCFPIIIIEPKSQVIAMIHGGWRSLVQNIIPLTIKELKYFHYHCEPEKLIAWIGPGIRKESYISRHIPVQSYFEEWAPFIEQSKKGYHIDLAEFAKHSLMECGIKGENIFDYEKDTYVEKETFFSHRRAKEKNDEDGRFLVAVWRN